ncbi:hypothetical protein K3495_g8377 [Podosphaera aphanis]|nr:hypothetical protein K3495_g8377 [Podosphaera aphanis]
MIGGLSPISLASHRDSLDRCASELTESICSAYAAAARRSFGHDKGNAWWNTSCKLARQKYKKVYSGPMTEDDAIRERNEYRCMIARAKKAHFTNKIAATASGKDIFALPKWHKSTGNFRSTHLKDPRFSDRPPATSLPDKIAILLGNSLTILSKVGGIPLDAPTVATRSISFHPLCHDEVWESILKAGNTVPEADEIPTAILCIAWPLIGECVYSLFDRCLSLGHHPICFRQAVLIMLHKPNKADLSSPRSHRPIVLLSVLGKGLEPLVAKRIAWITVHNKLLTTQKFGALPGRSAVDLTACLTHDVERALSERRTASMLTFDVKGAFDAVLSGRLVRRIREQGWPEPFVNWVASFATNCSVQIRLDGKLGPLQPINCSLP